MDPGPVSPELMICADKWILAVMCFIIFVATSIVCYLIVPLLSKVQLLKQDSQGVMFHIYLRSSTNNTSLFGYILVYVYMCMHACMYV